MKDVWVELFLALTFLSTAFSALGLLFIKDFFERLHFMAPAATVGIWSLALAILIQTGISQSGLKAVLCTALIFIMNPILTHATARAIRIHQFGQWQPKPEEKVPLVS